MIVSCIYCNRQHENTLACQEYVHATIKGEVPTTPKPCDHLWLSKHFGGEYVHEVSKVFCSKCLEVRNI